MTWSGDRNVFPNRIVLAAAPFRLSAGPSEHRFFSSSPVVVVAHDNNNKTAEICRGGVVVHFLLLRGHVGVLGR